MTVTTRAVHPVVLHAGACAVAGVVLGFLDASALAAPWTTLLVGWLLGAAQRVVIGVRAGPAWIAASGLAWAGGALLDTLVRAGAVEGLVGFGNGQPLQRIGTWVLPLACLVVAQHVLLGALRSTWPWTVSTLIAAVALQGAVTGTCAVACRPLAASLGPDAVPVVLTTVGFAAFGVVTGAGWSRLVALERRGHA